MSLHILQSFSAADLYWTGFLSPEGCNFFRPSFPCSWGQYVGSMCELAGSTPSSGVRAGGVCEWAHQARDIKQQSPSPWYQSNMSTDRWTHAHKCVRTHTDGTEDLVSIILRKKKEWRKEKVRWGDVGVEIRLKKNTKRRLQVVGDDAYCLRERTRGTQRCQKH